ncbi:hypothetical protein V2O64_00270 [Verrucomicrobiaceae bacterium 227]
MRRWLQSDVHICLVGVLVLATGIDSLFDLIVGFLADEGRFSPGFLLIGIGLGLLRGSNLQRSIFGGLLALALVGAVVLVVANSIYTAGYWVRGEGNGARFLWEGVLLLVGLCYCFIVLWDAKSDPWFSEKLSGKAPRYVIPVTVLLTLFLSGSDHYAHHQRKQAMAEVFRYDLKITAVDSETGDAIPGIAVGWSGGELGELDLPDFMRSSGGGAFESGGKEGMSLHGFARGWVIVTVSADGYETQFLSISEETPPEWEVRLEKISN